MKKTIALLLSAVMTITVCACGSTETAGTASSTAEASKAESADEDAMKIAVVFATGGLGDKTYNDSLYNGVKNICDSQGYSFDYSEPMDEAEYEPLLRGYASSGEYDLIISLGYSQGTSVEAVAPNYPDQKFMLIDATVECDNVVCYAWRENELSYMIGVMAGMMTESKTLGFIAAFDIFNCNMNAAGYTAGAQSVDPDINVIVNYLESWDDINACKEMAISMHEQGADIIYHAASTAGLGILQAGKEKGFYTIGFDGNVNGEAPETNFASAVRLFPVAVENCITSINDGKFVGGVVSLGCSEGACLADIEGTTVDIPQEVKDAVKKANDDIASGALTVPQTLDELK